MTKNESPTCLIMLEPVLLGYEEASKFLGIGRSTLYKLHSSGAIGPQPVTLGGRALWRRRELEAWVSSGCPRREDWKGSNDARLQNNLQGA